MATPETAGAVAEYLKAIIAETTGCTVKAIKGYCERNQTERNPDLAKSTTKVVGGNQPEHPGSENGTGKYDTYSP
jgi:hypothetical protein